MKKCQICKITQPLTEFCKCKVYADGYARRCKKCAKQYQIDHAEYFKQYRKTNIGKMTEYQKQYRLNKKKRQDNILVKYDTLQKSIEGNFIIRCHNGIWRIIKKLTSLRSK